VRIERIPRVKLIRVHYATQRTFVVQTLRRYHTFDETLTPHTPCARAPPELIYSTSLVKWSRSHRLLSLINILLNKLNILICLINDDDQGNPVISTPRTRVTSRIDGYDTGALYTLPLSRGGFSRWFSALIWNLQRATCLLPIFFDSQIKESQIRLYCSPRYFGARLRRTVIYVRSQSPYLNVLWTHATVHTRRAWHTRVRCTVTHLAKSSD